MDNYFEIIDNDHSVLYNVNRDMRLQKTEKQEVSDMKHFDYADVMRSYGFCLSAPSPMLFQKVSA